jgi:hypothetical protein
VLLFPAGAGIVNTFPASGGAEIIGDQAAGDQPLYQKLSQDDLSLISAIFFN